MLLGWQPQHLNTLAKKFVGFVSVIAGALTVCAEPPPSAPLHFTFTGAQILDETHIWKIVETPAHQMVAAGERVIFYQSGSWHAVRSFRRAAIRSLMIDGDKMWLTAMGTLGYMNLPLTVESKFEPVMIPGVAEAGEIWSLTRIGERMVAMGSEDVFIFNPSTLESKRTHLVSHTRILLSDLGDEHVVTQNGTVAWKIHGDELEPYRFAATKEPIHWFWGTRSLLIATPSLYRRTKDGYEKFDDSTNYWPKNTVIADLCDWDGIMAMAEIGRGLRLVDFKERKSITIERSAGLPSSSAYCVTPDSKGRLWVGTAAGIAVFESRALGTVYNLKDQPTIATLHKGLLISYETKAEYFHDSGTEEAIPERVYELIVSKNSYAYGLWGRIVSQSGLHTRAPNRIGASLVLPSGEVLVSSLGKLYLLNQTLSSSVDAPGTEAELTGFTIVDNVIWAVGSDGWFYQAPAVGPYVFQKVIKRASEGLAQVSHLGSELIVTDSAGIYHGLHMYPVRDADRMTSVVMAENADGLWALAKQDGFTRVGRIVRNADDFQFVAVEAKGLTSLVEPHWISGEGRKLLITGNSQLLELNTDLLKPSYNLSPPKLRFTYFDEATGHSITTDVPPKALRYNKNRILFSGAVAFDELGEKPSFDRRLWPTEEAWMAARDNESVNYSAMAAGNYRLDVRSNHLGHIGPIVSHEFVVLHPWFASPVAFSLYGAGALAGFYAVLRYRTKQVHKRNRELQRLVDVRTQELAKASAAKSEFLASMSHEIRNPMNGVIGLLRILPEEPPGPRQSRIMKLLLGCAEQLASTVDDILDFSKIEAGTVEVETYVFNVAETLEVAARTVDPTGHKVVFLHKPPPNYALRGDAGKLRQVFANFVSNALKYGTPPEARVTATVTPQDGKVQLLLAVSSSGPTIAQPVLDSFFESFRRGEEAVERNIRGTGLGLAICRRFAHAMGGEVTATSANGETTFFLKVSFESETELTTLAEKRISELPALKPGTALAIEDEQYNRVVLGNILGKLNFSVDWATNGEEAMELAREGAYDIILTDYRLPDITGVQLAKDILALNREPIPAIIAVTAYSTQERKDECMEVGMAGFISKPITIEKLHAALVACQVRGVHLRRTRAPIQDDITAAWAEVKVLMGSDATKAAFAAHKLNNVCIVARERDLSQQLEVLELAIECGSSTASVVDAIEHLLAVRTRSYVAK